MLQRILKPFWALLDNDSVRPFIPLYYAPFLAWGIYGSLAAEPIPLIADGIGQPAYDMWVWATIPGTVACMVGLWLRHGGSPATAITGPLLFRDYIGLWLQFGGHVFMAPILIIYEVTGFAGMYWGQPVISLFLISSYSLGVPVLAAQCLRKLWRGRQRQ